MWCAGRDLFTATHVHRLVAGTARSADARNIAHHPLIVGATASGWPSGTARRRWPRLRDAGVDGRALAADLIAGRFPVGFALANA